MAKKRKTPTKSSRLRDRALPRQNEPVPWPFQPGETEWTEEHVHKMLTNPIYGYGFVLEPFDAASDAVSQLEHVLAEEQHQRGRPFSLDELDQRFQKLFTDLVKRGICRRGPDAPSAVPKETWLKAQQQIIGRLERGESA